MHCIKKKPKPGEQRASKDSITVHACVPLRIEDIKDAVVEANQFTLFGRSFRLMTVYGMVTKVLRNENWNQRYGVYTIDDGSGQIIVHFNHLRREFKGKP